LVGPSDLIGLAKSRGVFVLSDVAGPVTAPPLAAVAFDIGTRSARLVALGVLTPLRRRGVGRRLMAGAMTSLQSEGVELVEAAVDTGTPAAAFLAAIGFEPLAGEPAVTRNLVHPL